MLFQVLKYFMLVDTNRTPTSTKLQDWKESGLDWSNPFHVRRQSLAANRKMLRNVQAAHSALGHLLVPKQTRGRRRRSFYPQMHDSHRQVYWRFTHAEVLVSSADTAFLRNLHSSSLTCSSTRNTDPVLAKHITHYNTNWLHLSSPG